MTDYHVTKSCNACGGDNDVDWSDYVDSHPYEAKTKCNQCGHNDYWAYGWFESGIGKCETYNFNQQEE